MANKRILHISKYYPPYAGGIEYVCYKVVSSLPQFEHSVICFNDRPETVTDEYEGVRVVRVGTFANVKSQALSLSYLGRLRREIRSFRPHIIHFHAPNPLVSLYLLAVIPQETKLIVHYHAEILTAPVLYASLSVLGEEVVPQGGCDRRDFSESDGRSGSAPVFPE